MKCKNVVMRYKNFMLQHFFLRSTYPVKSFFSLKFDDEDYDELFLWYG